MGMPFNKWNFDLLTGVRVFDGDFRFNLRAQNLVVRNACSLNLQSTIINNIARKFFCENNSCEKGLVGYNNFPWKTLGSVDLRIHRIQANPDIS